MMSKAITLKEVFELVSFEKSPASQWRAGQWRVKDVAGNVAGNVKGDVFGNVEGNVYGNVESVVYGNVRLNVWGNIGRNVYGNIGGYVEGNVGPKPKPVTKKKTGGKINGQKSKQSARRQKHAG